MIAVIDYGAGNLRSVANALDLLGAPYFLARAPGDLHEATAILLPGVGHFGQMVTALRSSGVFQTLRQKLGEDVPYLGVCLGMQALYQASEEAPDAPGLGVLAGSVLRFPPGPKVPHMGWSQVSPDAEHYYFAHSYYVPADAEGVSATAAHGIPFAAAIRYKNLWGAQFHPEKSGIAGLRYLKHWVSMCPLSAS